MSRYELSRRADADLAAIWRYIAQDSLEAADRQMDRFYEVFERLAAFPGLGRRQDEVASGLRSLPLGNYVIYYRQHANVSCACCMAHSGSGFDSCSSDGTACLFPASFTAFPAP